MDLAKVVEAIRRAEPDIVALQEAMGNADRIAASLGWGFASHRTQVISPHPIVDPPEADAPYQFVEVRPGRVVAVMSVHPPAEPYGPEAMLREASVAEVIELERRIRLPRLERPLAASRALIEAGIPVFLAGDFNAPSHLDWTSATVGLRRHVRAAVPWPVSRADRGGRVPRHVAGGPPGSARRARSDVVGRTAADRRLRAGPGHARRPDRHGLRGGAGARARLPDRRRGGPSRCGDQRRPVAVGPPGGRRDRGGRAAADGAATGEPRRGGPAGASRRDRTGPARDQPADVSGRRADRGALGAAARDSDGTGSRSSPRLSRIHATRTSSGGTPARGPRARSGWTARPPSSISHPSADGGPSHRGPTRPPTCSTTARTGWRAWRSRSSPERRSWAASPRVIPGSYFRA